MLLILTLAGGLVLQTALPIRTALPEDNALAPRRLRTPVPTMIPPYAAILQAPVFAPDRRPEGRASVQTLQLIGIAANGSMASAIVVTSDGASHVLKAGDSVEGWRLIAVSTGHATFDGPTGRAILPVTAPSPSPSPAAAAANPPVTP